jgi:hypothetical protein
MTPEQKRDLGIAELITLKQMWGRWLQRDIMWASEEIVKGNRTGKDGEWDFLLGDWEEKFYEWMYPYLKRLYETEHVLEQEIKDFATWAHGVMFTALDAINKLEVPKDG